MSRDFYQIFQNDLSPQNIEDVILLFYYTIYILEEIVFFLRTILQNTIGPLCSYGKRIRRSRKDSIEKHIFFREGVGVPPNNPVRVKQKHEKNEEEHSIIGGDSFFQIYLINHPN